MRDLTARQQEILGLIRQHIADTGFPPTRAEIAAKLGRAYLTVETHRRNISAKLGSNRGDLIKMASFYNQTRRAAPN